MRVTCPACREMLQIADGKRGAIIACLHCGKSLRVPTLKPQDDEVYERVDDCLEPEPDANQEDEKPDRKKRKLGEMKREFRTEAGAFVWHGLGLIALPLAASYFIYEAQHSVRVGVSDWPLTLTVCGLIALLLLGLCGLLFWRTAVQWKKRVVLADNGIAVVLGGRRTVYLWDDIADLYQEITDHYVDGKFVYATHRYTLITRDSERVLLGDELKKVHKLGQVIAARITERELPRALKDYDAGRLVDFGQLAVDQEGLSYGDSFLRWREIECVAIAKGYISVNKRGKWFNWCNIAAARVPNLHVFLALVDEIKGIKGM